jgi:hypothetical protein
MKNSQELYTAFAFEHLASRRRQEAKLPGSSAPHLVPVAWTDPLAHSNPKKIVERDRHVMHR